MNQPRTSPGITLEQSNAGVSNVSETRETARQIFEVGLRNQHAVENQAIELLERQIGRLENYPAMRERMEAHVKESQAQAARLEELLGTYGTSHSSLKDAAMSLMGNLAALAHTPAPDEVVKNSFANFAFEHFEIAAYKSLLTLADLIGNDQATGLLKQSLAEEEAMARWIDEHLAETTRMYVTRRAEGETAGR